MRRVWKKPVEDGASGDEAVEIEPGALTGIFASPQWLRDLGFSAWLLVGVGAALIGLIWLLSLTQTIVMPVITAAIIASVASPLVGWLRRHGLPRGIGAALVLLAIVALAFGVGLIVLTGISSQADGLSARLQEGVSQLESWARDLGVKAPTAADANAEASTSVSGAFQALTQGLLGSVDRLASSSCSRTRRRLAPSSSAISGCRPRPLTRCWGGSPAACAGTSSGSRSSPSGAP
jgi:hypothetical protein